MTTLIIPAAVSAGIIGVIHPVMESTIAEATLFFSAEACTDESVSSFGMPILTSSAYISFTSFPAITWN